MSDAPASWPALWSAWKARLNSAHQQGSAIDEELTRLEREIAVAVGAGRYGEAVALTLLVSTARAARDDAELDWPSAVDDAPARALFWVRWAQALDGELRDEALILAIAGASTLALLEAAPLATPSTRALLIAALQQQAEHDDFLRPAALLTVAVLERNEKAFVAQVEGLRRMDPDCAIPLTTVSDPALARAAWEQLQTWPAPDRLRLGGWLVPQLEGDDRARAAAAQLADYLSSDRPDLWLAHADHLATFLEREPLDRLVTVWREHQPLYRAPQALRRLAELGAPDEAIACVGDLDADYGRRHQQLVALRGVLAVCPPPLQSALAERMAKHDATYDWPDVLAAVVASDVDEVVARVDRTFALNSRLRVWAALPDRTLAAHATGWLATVAKSAKEPDAAPLLALAARADVLDTPTRSLLLNLCLQALARTSRLNIFGCDDHQGLSELVPLIHALGGPPAIAEVSTALRDTFAATSLSN